MNLNLDPSKRARMSRDDRPFLTLPADQPSYEELTELTMQQKAALPARFHTPAFSDAQPPLFLCRVCWDGETSEITTWPCASALKAGWDVFGPEKQATHTHTDDCMCLMAPMVVEGASECHHCGGHTGGPCGSRCDITRAEVIARG